MDLPPAPTPPSGGNAPPNANHTTTLLNLLKFSQANASQSSAHRQQQHTSPGSLDGAPAPPPPPHQTQRDIHDFHQPMSAPRILQPAPATADPSGLLAALMRGTHESEEQRAESQPAPQRAPQPVGAPASYGHHTAAAPGSAGDARFLLDLLNRPKPSQTEQSPRTDTDAPVFAPQHPPQPDHAAEALRNLAQAHPGSGPASSSSHVPVSNFSYEQQRSFDPAPAPTYSYSSPQEAPPTNSSNPYGYNNPFDDYSASQDRPSNLRPSELMSHVSPQFHILKKTHSNSGSSRTGAEHGSSAGRRSPTASPTHDRRKFVQSSSPNAGPTPGTTVSYNSFPLERGKETVADALDDIAPRVDYEAQAALARLELQRGAETQVANDITDMLHGRDDSDYDPHHAGRDDDDGFIDRTPPLDASEDRNIADSVQGVADSWESADQDENVVLDDESKPIQVYNFPMRPWIAITLKDDVPEQRPQFNDKQALDIARLKKDFDQMDRNLYTATENYMTYGMSKAGGLRVIRQDDGRDAKVFTDTKDRIFNVSMSVTPPEHHIQKEAIIGTGTSGTVYWVQIKEGDKDHIEEPNLEQYGFALPPISLQDGDAPGGVVKTRARASTAHPEFFAVGRGKSINIIWPSYIIRENLFQPGHDRVVDTDRLIDQCSLKINTGKAGKDFTFSQDDTVIVSLDKSGRVKFWDVRELTAAADDRGDRPLHTSLEVKEPLLTVGSTPDGEKAWPTSVLLLDKLRPYQKRCALRYMIVGMKQNHTLQLWDLALGKPVQEFNLPHSKESDAVCSVVYHPPTGMLVIGHPTRNSIYFAHLSAPKYNLKNWSQVEYIQRLAVQDPSLPAPDSTAVLSGIREYSFDNKGVLRSLDILCNPAVPQDDSIEPSLFELYVMHSKGVACLHIKQAELGWSKDNKVLNGVDAVEANVVVIGKLKSVNSAPIPAEAQPEESQIRIAVRPKDASESTPVQDDDARNGSELGGPPKAPEPKEEDPATNQDVSEKIEKKYRKKKPTANEALNPTGNSPRATPSSAKNNETAKNPGNGSHAEATPANPGGLEGRLVKSLGGAFEKSLKSVLDKVDESSRARDVEFDARQSKLLEMVSNVLNDNTQKVLEALVRDQFAESVIPAVSDATARAVSEQLKTAIHGQVPHAIQREVSKTMPSAVQQAVHSHEFVGGITDRVGASIGQKLQQELAGPFLTRLGPVVAQIAAQSYQRVADETQQLYRAEFERLHQRIASDANKVDQALGLVTRLTDMVSTMANTQAQFQAEFLKFQQQVARERQLSDYQTSAQTQVHSPPQASNSQVTPNRGPLGSLGGALPYGIGPAVHATQNRGPQQSGAAPDDTNLDRVIQQMETAFRLGQYNDGILTWIQSNLESDVFARYLHKVSPTFIQELSPLMLLSMAASLAMQLEGNSNVRDKIVWLEIVLHTFHTIVNDTVSDGLSLMAQELRVTDERLLQDAQIRDVTPRIMGVVVERCESLILRISSNNPSEPILKNLSQMVLTAKRILDATRGIPTGRYDDGRVNLHGQDRY